MMRLSKLNSVTGYPSCISISKTTHISTIHCLPIFYRWLIFSLQLRRRWASLPRIASISKKYQLPEPNPANQRAIPTCTSDEAAPLCLARPASALPLRLQQLHERLPSREAHLVRPGFLSALRAPRGGV